MNDGPLPGLAEQLKNSGQPFAVATVVRTEDLTSAKPGARALIDTHGEIHGWIGGGCTQPAVRRAALSTLSDARPRLIRIRPDGSATTQAGVEEFTAHCHSGGTLDIFIEPVLPPPSLLIFGASPSGQCLADLALRYGYRVSAAVANADHSGYPQSVTIVEGFEAAAATGATPGSVLVATQGRGDLAALQAALSIHTEYIGFISSRRKALKLKQELLDHGYNPDRIAAIHAPAGLDIGAATAAEIALSILAEITRKRRLSRNLSQLETSAIAKP